MSKPTDKPTADNNHPLTRRAFLRGSLAAAAGGLLAACGVQGDVDVRPLGRDYHTATPRTVLQSPQARPGEGTPQPGTPEPEPEGQLGLDQFLALSAVLTGVANLDPTLGRVYLNALRAGDFELAPADLYRRAGFSPDAAPSLDDVENSGIFDDEATGALADTIIRYWYTGVYDTPDGEPAVATFVDALAWKALPWTKPNSICAQPGFWEKRPNLQSPISQAEQRSAPISDLQSPRTKS
ncbi:MAG TPA: sugar dehydrogenase complex small subunit [Candidatus Sulfomarinibacteraceae bacterium]|nr:sugar dehydrogenase complex small subunit [Candidatus Sulfomarinibacteraceae bacterium]